MKIWIDGRIVDGADARVSVLDHGFLYGDGVFEGIRAYGGRVFRLERSPAPPRGTGARARARDPGRPRRRARASCSRRRARTAPPDAYVRFVVSRGVGALGVDPTTCPEPRVVCIVATIRIFPPEKLARGHRAS